ncbi:MAG: hypothetical protein K8T25_17660 [Planctomycetia bacterium]|nr:hypothetical protein [Planctomycetia bacterium]
MRHGPRQQAQDRAGSTIRQRGRYRAGGGRRPAQCGGGLVVDELLPVNRWRVPAGPAVQ